VNLSSTATQVPPPSVLHALSALDRTDYEDLFQVPVAQLAPAPAETWARRVLEQAPVRRRGALLAGWTLLGLDLDPRSRPDRVLGWQLADREPGAVVLQARSPLGITARLVVCVDSEHLSLGTFLRFERGAGRRAFAAIASTHRRVVPELLDEAVARQLAATA
jgi:hypothetical protein